MRNRYRLSLLRKGDKGEDVPATRKVERPIPFFFPMKNGAASFSSTYSTSSIVFFSLLFLLDKKREGNPLAIGRRVKVLFSLPLQDLGDRRGRGKKRMFHSPFSGSKVKAWSFPPPSSSGAFFPYEGRANVTFFFF